MKRVQLYPLVFVLLITLCSQTLFAADSRYDVYAEKLSQIGVFKGSDEGFDLERQPTRLEGLIMLIRLLGKEEEALLLSSHPSHFNDVPDWGRGYVNYAYDNGLTTGISSTAFGSMQLMDSKSYMTFLLRALGYNDKEGDFSWNTSLDYAKTIGLISENQWFELGSQTFLRDHVAKLSYDALGMYLKGSETTLLEDLIAKGAVNTDVAQSLNTEPSADNNPKDSLDTGLSDMKDSALLDRAIQACVYIEVTDIFGNISSGSGFYIDAQGTLVTNYHVIEYAKKISITQDDGSTYNGSVTVKGYDASLDLALLKINYNSTHYLTRSNSDKVLRSQTVYAIGSPLGLQNTISEGLISRIYKDDSGNKHFQISNAISPGSSGGALIDTKGHVIGVTNAVYSEGENLGLAIPINHLDHIANKGNYTLSGLFNTQYVNDHFRILVLQDDNTTSLFWPNLSTEEYRIEMSVNNGPFEEIWGVDPEALYLSDYNLYGTTLDNLMKDRSYRFKITALYDDVTTTYSAVSEAVKGTGSLYNVTDLINDLHNLDIILGNIHVESMIPSIDDENGDITFTLFFDQANTLAFTQMTSSQKEIFYQELRTFIHQFDSGMGGETYWFDLYSVNFTATKPTYLDDLFIDNSFAEPYYSKLEDGTWYGELNVAWGYMDVDDQDHFIRFNDGIFLGN